MPTNKKPRRSKGASSPARPASARSSASVTGRVAAGRSGKSGRGRGGGRARKSSASLAALSTEALAAELRRRRSEIPRLEAEAVRLRAALGAVEERIAFLERIGGGSAPAGADGARKAPRARIARSGPKASASPRSRTKRDGQPTLGERIAGLLEERKGVLSPREIAEAMGSQLGREVNQSLLVHVSLTLRKLVNQGRIRQPGRGQYAAATPEGGLERISGRISGDAA